MNTLTSTAHQTLLSSIEISSIKNDKNTRSSSGEVISSGVTETLISSTDIKSHNNDDCNNKKQIKDEGKQSSSMSHSSSSSSPTPNSSATVSASRTEIIDCIHREEWGKVVELLEEDPSLTKQEVSMIYQGETSKCSLLHLVCATKCTTVTNENPTTTATSKLSSNMNHTCPPVFVFDTIISKNPSALLQQDNCGGRLPIHVLLFKQGPIPSKSVLQYFIDCSTLYPSLNANDQWMIQDHEGNTALHYAAMYCCLSSTIFQMVLNVCPNACSISNTKTNRTPVHLLCAKWNDGTTEAAISATKNAGTTTTTATSSPPNMISNSTAHTVTTAVTDGSSIDSCYDEHQQLPISPPHKVDDDKDNKNHHHHHQQRLPFTKDDLLSCIEIDNSILRQPDKYGRLPLHLIVHHRYPKWDFVDIVLHQYPDAVIRKDQMKHTPIDLAKMSNVQKSKLTSPKSNRKVLRRFNSKSASSSFGSSFGYSFSENDNNDIPTSTTNNNSNGSMIVQTTCNDGSDSNTTTTTMNLSKLETYTIEYQQKLLGKSPIICRIKQKMNTQKFLKRSNSKTLDGRKVDADLIEQCRQLNQQQILQQERSK